MALPIGTILNGKFRIIQILGEGGMGTVYKVEQLGTSHFYAVKELLISPNTSEEDRRTAIERFNKEIDLLRSLRHPRIAALTHPFQDRGNYYFAMDFVPGRSLEKILETSKAPLPEDQVVHWMIQVCEALSYIHTQRPPIILRDLKPGNIMISPNNEVQLIDFGIARRFDPNKRTNTENLGTISYASPEHLGSIAGPGQKRSSKNPGRLVQTDSRSDIYSLGATMYHLLTNYEPDPIQTPAPGSILAKNPRLRTMQVGNRVICPVEQVIIKAMQQEATQRFQNAEAMRVALQHCLSGAAITPSTIQIPAMTANSTIIVPILGGGIVCPRCGLQNRPGAKFCQRDGAPLQAAGRTNAPRRVPIKARPVQQPIKAPNRPQPIMARPITGIQATPIKSKPVANSNVATAPRAPATIQATQVAKPQPAQNDANSLYRRGLQALTNKAFSEAIQSFQQALKAGGPPYEIAYNLGRAYRQTALTLKESDRAGFQDNLRQAVKQFEQAITLNSNALDAHFQLGMTYRDLEHFAPASNAFKRARNLNPKDPATYYQLGLIMMDQHAYREAEAYFHDGLVQKPDHTLILLAQGRLYLETKRIPLATSTLRKALMLDADLWPAWYELGRAHIRGKEWAAALSALERARKIVSFQVDIYLAMANCYFKLNKKTEARQLIDEILKHNPKNGEALRLQKQL